MNDVVAVCPISNVAEEICQCAFCNIDFVAEFLAPMPETSVPK